MKGSRPALPDDFATLWFLVRRVAALMDRSGEELFRSRLGVSLAQFLVLSVVDAHPGPLNQQAIAERVGLTKGTVSRQIEQATSAGLMQVEVAAHSRRENSVSLTPAGTDLVRRGDELFQKRRLAALPALDADDLAGAIRTLAALKHAFDDDAPATPEA
jgi:DNA-binding MarR family transcriptional regulator